MLLHLLLIAESLVSFSFDLQREVQNKNENGIYSPLSISTTLGMVAEGADEDTLNQILKALHFEGSEEELGTSFKDLITNEMQHENGYPNLTLNMETVLWMQKDFEFLPQYQSVIVKDFFGDLRNIDFSKPEEAVKEMNRWFFQKTGGAISPLFTNRDITTSTRLVAVSTLFLKSYFEKPFDPSHTRMKPFHLDEAKDISIQMMSQKSEFPYYKGQGFQVVELNYLPLAKQFALWIVLPDNGLFPLSQAQFEGIGDNLVNEMVDLEVPRFQLESSLNLIPALQKLGIKDAFNNDADFTRMSEGNDLMITDFKHKALLIVEEAGTVAEAATSATFSIKATPPTNKVIHFHVDHPFLFFIVDKKNNLPLFMGQVVEPKASTQSQF